VATVLNSLADHAASGDARLVPNPLPSLGDLNKAGIEHSGRGANSVASASAVGVVLTQQGNRSSSPPAPLLLSF
jgi:hypothetical protein